MTRTGKCRRVWVPAWGIAPILAALVTAGCSEDAGGASAADAGTDRASDGSADAGRDVSVDLAPPDAADRDSGGAGGDLGDTASGVDGAQDGSSDALDEPPGEDTGDDPLLVDAAEDLPGEDSPADAKSDTEADCESARVALTAELYEQTGACTVTVRLDYESFDILGYQVFCAHYASVDEESARSTAQADSGYGDAGTMLNGADPEDYYVFYESPGDFGGAAAVSAENGLTTFGGSIIWDGTGAITYPDSWRDPAGLASGCDPSGGISVFRGWDLRSGTALSEEDVQDALDVVLQTAVPAAFWYGGYVFDGVVLLYPRSVGVFDPSSAEWIVMVSGGWLE